MSDLNQWRCTSCNKVKELSGPHLTGKTTVRSDCWPCAKKRTFALTSAESASTPSAAALLPAPVPATAAVKAAPVTAVSNPFVTAGKPPAATTTATAAAAPSSTGFQFAGGKTGNPFLTTSAPAAAAPAPTSANPFVTAKPAASSNTTTTTSPFVSAFAPSSASPFVSAFSAPPKIPTSTTASTSNPNPFVASSAAPLQPQPQPIVVNSVPRASPPFSFTAPPKSTTFASVFSAPVALAPSTAAAAAVAAAAAAPVVGDASAPSWRCATCQKVKDLSGPHLNGKNTVRSDCWPCAKKRTFVRWVDGKPIVEVQPTPSAVVSTMEAAAASTSSTGAASASLLERSSSMQRATSGEAVFLPPSIPSSDQQVQFFLGQVPQSDQASTLVSSFGNQLAQSYLDKTRDGSLRRCTRLYSQNALYVVLQTSETAVVTPRSVADIAAVLMHVEASDSKAIRTVYCPDMLTMAAAALYVNLTQCRTAVCGPEVDRTRNDPCQLRAVLEATAATARQNVPRHTVVSADSRLAAAKSLLHQVGLAVPPAVAAGEALRLESAKANAAEGLDVVLVTRTVAPEELHLLRSIAQ